ncbi:peptidoglycan-binding protein [Rothia dentocariosa]|uniref:peptidoglycan-binding protein n=1 Tax=Rothia dentocariosa TaxID=2047 RepID=UPI0028DC4316|nr:peptidoglycan-binding protein [Rothia dentocariosa]
MTLENPGISRRKLLRTTAIGVPAAGMLAFGSTLVTATSANALEVDGYWGSETTRMYQRLAALEVVDGIVSSQPASQASANPGLTSGWDWVSDDAASGSETIKDLQRWLKVTQDGLMGSQTISALQARYHLPQDGVLSEESPTIKKLQSELIAVTYD